MKKVLILFLILLIFLSYITYNKLSSKTFISNETFITETPSPTSIITSPSPDIEKQIPTFISLMEMETLDSIPRPVINLTATIEGGQTTLSWDAPLKSSNYKIYKNNVYLDTTTNRSYTVTNLDNGKQYKFSISAGDSQGGYSFHSSVFVTPLEKPGPVYISWNPYTLKLEIYYIYTKKIAPITEIKIQIFSPVTYRSSEINYIETINIKNTPPESNPPYLTGDNIRFYTIPLDRNPYTIKNVTAWAVNEFGEGQKSKTVTISPPPQYTPSS